MAKSLVVRNLDDEAVVKLQLRAALNGRSAESEHREILKQVLLDEFEFDFLEMAAKIRDLTKDRTHTPSEVLLREIRQER